MSWTAGLDLRHVLAAAHRRERHLAGEEIPAWGEPGADPAWGEPAADPAWGEPAADRARSAAAGEWAVAGSCGADDDMANGQIQSTGEVVPLAALAGHAVMPPSADLAGWLSTAAPADLDDAALVTSITAWRKLTSWATAHEIAAVAELARRRGVPGAGRGGVAGPDRVPEQGGVPGRGPGGGSRGPDSGGWAGRTHGPGCASGASANPGVPDAEFAADELALALTLTSTSAEWWMDLAVDLARVLPATLSALSEGRIDLPRARLIAHWTHGLDADLARKVEDMVLPRAERQTTGQLRAALQRAVLAADPQRAKQRRQEAEKDARLEIYGDHDGTAALGGRFLPAAQVAAAWARISAMARAMQSSGAGGGMDFLRAHVFVGLLLGTLPPIRPSGQEHDGPPDGPPDGPDSGPGDSGPGDCDNASPRGAGGSREAEGPGEADSSGGGAKGRRAGRAVAGAAAGAVGGAGSGTPDRQSLWDGVAPPHGEDAPEQDGMDDGGAPGRPVNERGGQATGPPPQWPGVPGPGVNPAPGCAPSWPGWAASDSRTPGLLRARLRLSVPWRTLANLREIPGCIGRISPVGADVARELAEAAAEDPSCSWKVIVVGSSGRALAVAAVGAIRQRATRLPRPCGVSQEPGVVGQVTITVPVGMVFAGGLDLPPGTGVLGAVLAAAAKAAASAIAARPPQAGPCTHRDASPGYRVPERLRALTEARDQTCRFPPCRQPASRCDQDHTKPYREGGLTCSCNLSNDCRRHHRLKHQPAWRLVQPREGVLRWITPARLSHTVTPDPHLA